MNLSELYGRVVLSMRSSSKVIGWDMKPAEAVSFIRGLGKTVLTFFGYMADYQDRDGMLKLVRETLASYSPQKMIVNMGATKWGLGIAYEIAKPMGFTTTAVVSHLAISDPGSISSYVDYLCFVKDNQWGGRLPNSAALSPTSQAMVECSDILIAIGGNEISRDELVAAQAMGKPIQYYPAEIDHEWLIRRMKKQGKPAPQSFYGAVHEVFGNKS